MYPTQQAVNVAAFVKITEAGAVGTIAVVAIAVAVQRRLRLAVLAENNIELVILPPASGRATGGIVKKLPSLVTRQTTAETAVADSK